MSTTQMFRIYIKATPEAVWDAITSPEWNDKYGYMSRSEYELNAGGSYKSFATEEMRGFGMPEVLIDGEVMEADPPKKLVHSFHAFFSPEMAAEKGVVVTYLIEPEDERLTRVTIVTDENDSPVTLATVSGGDAKLADGGGGFPFILSDLKSLLESASSA